MPHQGLGVTAGRQASIRNLPCLQQAYHLFEMMQFLPRQPRSHQQQLGALHIAVHQAHGGGGRLLFTVGMIDKQQILMLQRGGNPGSYNFV